MCNLHGELQIGFPSKDMFVLKIQIKENEMRNIRFENFAWKGLTVQNFNAQNVSIPW